MAHAPLKIGVVHGHLSVPVGEHDALAAVARQMDVDVLVSGHTHKYARTSLRHDLTWSSSYTQFIIQVRDFRKSRTFLYQPWKRDGRMDRGLFGVRIWDLCRYEPRTHALILGRRYRHSH